jgi:hypothetical protein
MENRLVHEQCVAAYLILVTEVIRRNGNRTENLVIVLLDYDLLKSIRIGISVIGKMLFSLMNLIAKFLIEKTDLSYVVFHQNLINHLIFNDVFKMVVDQLACGEL